MTSPNHPPQVRRPRRCGPVLLLVAAVAAIPSGSVAGEIPTGTPVNRILTVAQRGAQQSVPEATLPAIEKAVELEFDYVELDFRFTSDGVPVLMHDTTKNEIDEVRVDQRSPRPSQELATAAPRYVAGSSTILAVNGFKWT